MPNDSISSPASPSSESSPISSTTTTSGSDPTPSSQTSPVASELSGSVPNEPAFDGFEGLGNDFDELSSLEPQVTPPVAPAIEKPAVPVAPPAVQPQQTAQTPQVSPPPAAAQAPAAAPAANGAQQPQTETAPAGVDDILTALEQDQGNIVNRVVQSFTLTDEQAAAFEADPVKALPQLASQVYMRAVTTTLQYMKQLVPTMLYQQMAQVEQAKQAEEEFFKMWPTLDREKHRQDIRTFGQAFFQANPNISRQMLFQLVGPAVMAKYGIAPNQAPAPQAPSPPTPGYRPVASSAPVVVQTQQLNENPFLGLGQDFDS